MEGDEIDGNEATSSQRASTRVRSRRDPFLIVCRCFSVVVSLTAILCIVVNVLSAVRSFKNGSDVFDGIFRCYAVVIAVFVVLAETEWGFIFKFSRILEYWAGRGMLQIFVAVMTRAFPDTSGEKVVVLLQNIASYLLLACGAVYFILGILCIGFLKRARQNDEITREQAAKDLELQDVYIIDEARSGTRYGMSEPPRFLDSGRLTIFHNQATEGSASAIYPEKTTVISQTSSQSTSSSSWPWIPNGAPIKVTVSRSQEGSSKKIVPWKRDCSYQESISNFVYADRY